MSYVDRCVTNVEYVRVVHRSRLLDCIKSCCYIGRYSPLDLFEPAERVKRIPQQIYLSILSIVGDFVIAIISFNFISFYLQV